MTVVEALKKIEREKALDKAAMLYTAFLCSEDLTDEQHKAIELIEKSVGADISLIDLIDAMQIVVGEDRIKLEQCIYDMQIEVSPVLL